MDRETKSWLNIRMGYTILKVLRSNSSDSVDWEGEKNLSILRTVNMIGRWQYTREVVDNVISWDSRLTSSGIGQNGALQVQWWKLHFWDYVPFPCSKLLLIKHNKHIFNCSRTTGVKKNFSNEFPITGALGRWLCLHMLQTRPMLQMASSQTVACCSPGARFQFSLARRPVFINTLKFFLYWVSIV